MADFVGLQNYQQHPFHLEPRQLEAHITPVPACLSCSHQVLLINLQYLWIKFMSQLKNWQVYTGYSRLMSKQCAIVTQQPSFGSGSSAAISLFPAIILKRTLSFLLHPKVDASHTQKVRPARKLNNPSSLLALSFPCITQSWGCIQSYHWKVIQYFNPSIKMSRNLGPEERHKHLCNVHVTKSKAKKWQNIKVLPSVRLIGLV